MELSMIPCSQVKTNGRTVRCVNERQFGYCNSRIQDICRRRSLVLLGSKMSCSGSSVRCSFKASQMTSIVAVHKATVNRSPPSSSQFTASQSDTSSSSILESFSKFFDLWLAEQSQLLNELTSAIADSESNLRSLIGRVLHHYESYYTAKSRSAQRDIFAILSPPWRSPLETAFLWIGGWRPSSAFHLLYSKAGFQFESGLGELIRGVSTGDLGDLSPSQLEQVDSLQKETVEEEKLIAEAMAAVQETMADSSMVQLSHDVTEFMRIGESFHRESLEDRLDSLMAVKEERLRGTLQRADDLRLKTLRILVIHVLTPIQAVHFLRAAAELHIRVHEWGKKRNAD